VEPLPESQPVPLAPGGVWMHLSGDRSMRLACSQDMRLEGRSAMSHVSVPLQHALTALDVRQLVPPEVVSGQGPLT